MRTSVTAPFDIDLELENALRYLQREGDPSLDQKITVTKREIGVAALNAAIDVVR